MKKKFDPDSLIGGPIVTTQRTEMPVSLRPWHIREDLLLWPVLAPCQSQEDWRAASIGVLAALNRPSQASEGHSGTNVNRRMITEHIDVGDYPKKTSTLQDWAERYLPPFRDGLRLSWIEYQVLIPGYWAKPDNPIRPHRTITVLEFLRLLGRSPADEWLIQQRMQELDEHGKVYDEGNNRKSTRSPEYWNAVRNCANFGLERHWTELIRMSHDTVIHDDETGTADERPQQS